MSCKIQINQDTKTTYVMQPHLINSLIEKFGKEVMNLIIYGTLGTPRFKIERSDDEDKIDLVMQSNYGSGVGMLGHIFETGFG